VLCVAQGADFHSWFGAVRVGDASGRHRASVRDLAMTERRHNRVAAMQVRMADRDRPGQ
jgi:hypothetical protein